MDTPKYNLTFEGIPIIRSDNLVFENGCYCNHLSLVHTSTYGCSLCTCTKYRPIDLASVKSDQLIQYTADQLDIPYRVSKAGREYCVYYISMGKDLIELVIMSNIIIHHKHDSSGPWYVTWTTPTTIHKETIAKFTDLLALIQLLTEGVNAKRARKTEAYK